MKTDAYNALNLQNNTLTRQKLIGKRQTPRGWKVLYTMDKKILLEFAQDLAKKNVIET